MQLNSKQPNTAPSEANLWFDDMVSNLRVDELKMEVGILDKKTAAFYDAMIKGDGNAMHNFGRRFSSEYFIKKLLNSYISELVKRNGLPEKLAFDMSDSKVLVWAQIKDDDEQVEKSLILSAAIINYEFEKYGFHISTTIVEEEDSLEIPTHYKSVELKGK